MRFAAWNKSTYVDLIVLITKVLVAAALIGHAHYIQSHLYPEPVYGVLDNADYAHSVQETEGLLVKVSSITGGYVLISSAIGLLGRFLHAAPLYGLYYCANVFGFGICLAAAIIPTMWGTNKAGYCLAAEESCMAVDDLAACPYPVTFTSDGRGRFLAEGDAAAAAAAAAGGGLTSSSPCCYLPEFVRFCGTFLGAVYTQTIIAVVLLALVMTQSMVSCFYLCCDCDRPWTAKGRVPDMPDLPEFTVPMPRRYRGITAAKKEEEEAAAEKEKKKVKEKEKEKRKSRAEGGEEEEGKKGDVGGEAVSSASAVEEGTAGVAGGAAAGAAMPPAIPPAAGTGLAQVTAAAAAAAAAAGLTSAAIEEKEGNGDG